MIDLDRREAAFRRYTDMSVDALRELWAKEERTDWAEAALHDALIERGVSSDELDAIVSRRAELAESSPPSTRDTIWKYGFIGRLVAFGCAVAAGAILNRLFGTTASTLGASLVFLAYVLLLGSRVSMHRGQNMRAGVRVWMYWQYIEAIIIMSVLMLMFLLFVTGSM